MASRRAFRPAARAALGAAPGHSVTALGMRKPAWTRAPYWRLTLEGSPRVEHRRPGQTLREETLTLAGAGAYSAAGYAPSGASYWLDDTSALDTLCSHTSLDTLLILCTLTVATAPTSTQGLLQWGARSRASPGGIYLSLISSSRAQLGVFPATTGTSGATATATIATGEQISLCAVVSYETDEIYLAKDGDLGAAQTGNTASVLSAMRAADTAPASTSGDYGASIMAGHNAAADTAQQALNVGSGSTSLLDIMLVRLPGALMHRASTIYREYAAAPTAPRYAALASL